VLLWSISDGLRYLFVFGNGATDDDDDDADDMNTPQFAARYVASILSDHPQEQQREWNALKSNQVVV